MDTWEITSKGEDLVEKAWEMASFGVFKAQDIYHVRNTATGEEKTVLAISEDDAGKEIAAGNFVRR